MEHAQKLIFMGGAMRVMSPGRCPIRGTVRTLLVHAFVRFPATCGIVAHVKQRVVSLPSPGRYFERSRAMQVILFLRESI